MEEKKHSFFGKFNKEKLKIVDCVWGFACKQLHIAVLKSAASVTGPSARFPLVLISQVEAQISSTHEPAAWREAKLMDTRADSCVSWDVWFNMEQISSCTGKPKQLCCDEIENTHTHLNIIMILPETGTLLLWVNSANNSSLYYQNVNIGPHPRITRTHTQAHAHAHTRTHVHLDFVLAMPFCLPTSRSDHVAAGCWCWVLLRAYRGSARGEMFHFDIHANWKVAQQSTNPALLSGNVIGGEGRRREGNVTAVFCRGWFCCQIVSPLLPNSGRSRARVCSPSTPVQSLPSLGLNVVTKCIKRPLYLKATVPF